MIIPVLIISAITIAYFWLKLNYQYWKKRGIPGPEPHLLVGNLGKCFLLKSSPGHIYTSAYNAFPDANVIGMYRATTPILLVRDPEMVKEVTVKSFSSFHDNDIDVDKNVDGIFGRSPLVLKGQEWKMVRAQLTPAFTSGKMKSLFPLLEDNGIKMVKYLETLPEATNGDGYEAKELSVQFTLNNIASSIFGLEGKCFEEQNSHFRQLATEFFSAESEAVFKFFVMVMFPGLAKLLRLRFVPKQVEVKLIDIVTQTLKYRRDNNVVRHDFLHIMNQIKENSQSAGFSEVDVTAHAAGFFGDGYETSSIVMSFFLFNLSNNPVAQKKLREEIDAAFEDNDNKLPYDVLQGLSYLDAALNESLRIYPPVIFLQRRCTKAFTFTPKMTNKLVTIDEGTTVILPIYGLQNDPKYYEEPDSYKPERFLGSNKDNLTKHTFLPLGEGPRSCLGQRFGFLQVKIGVAYIVRHYELSVNEKTKLPIQFDKTNIMTSPVGGLWLDFKKVM
ncbi:hypothetical protein MTP99_004957 [Tenebrio molitor]|jgi:cytochrome P450|nr:hypothetical protein MTP99_004957 [Tenebrio molitor]